MREFAQSVGVSHCCCYMITVNNTFAHICRLVSADMRAAFRVGGRVSAFDVGLS